MGRLAQHGPTLDHPYTSQIEGKLREVRVRLGKMGTSAPQVSRTERKPERANVQTLMRYADAVGMTLDVNLVAKH